MISMMDLQMFKGGSSTTVNNTSTYTPSEYELQLQKAQANYADAIAPNSLWLNETARNVLQDSLGAVQVDFNGLNQAAQNQISAAQAGIGGLTQGVLPAEYQKNMEASILGGVQNSVGGLLNGLGQRGVLNSSVTQKGMADISNSAANAMANAYTTNIGLLGNLYNNQINNATAGVTTAAAAQEGAQTPAVNLWNTSLGLNSSTTGALAAAAGKGTSNSTQTTKQSGGGGIMSGLLGGLF